MRGRAIGHGGIIVSGFGERKPDSGGSHLAQAPRVIYLREELPAGPIDMAALRAAFGRLMDRAARQVMLEGRDLDDTICDRLAELAFAGEETTFRVECRSTLDAEPLSEEFRRMHAERFGVTDETAEIRLHAAWVRVRLYGADVGHAG